MLRLYNVVSRTEDAEEGGSPTTSLHGRECASAISKGAVMASRGDSTLRLPRQPAWNDVAWDDIRNLGRAGGVMVHRHSATKPATHIVRGG